MADDTSHSRWFWRFIIIGILGVGIGGFFLLQLLQPRPTEEPPRERAPLIQGEAIDFRTGPVPVQGKGRVEPVSQVRLQAQVAGDVVYVAPAFESGARFAKGETLLKVNPDPFRARVMELEAQIAAAQADIELAQTQADRANALLAARATSQEEVDQREAAVKAAAAQVKRLEASLYSANVDLARTSIKAPFNGRILSETVSIGDVLAPGTVFAEIFSDDVFEIIVSLPEEEAGLVEDLFSAETRNTPVDVTAVFDSALFSWTGRLAQVEPGLDREARTIDLVIYVDDPSTPGTPVFETLIDAPPLLPGMFATVSIEGRDVGRYASIPRQALRERNDVWIVRPDSEGRGKIEVTQVQVLKTSESVALVRTELETDVPIYSVHSLSGRVVPGSEVIIREARPEGADDTGAAVGEDATDDAPESAR